MAMLGRKSLLVADITKRSKETSCFRILLLLPELMTEKIYGTIAVYGAGGYLLRLPLDNKSEAADLIAGVKANRWIDRGSRAVMIDFTMFNANVNLFSIARMLLELPASGGVLPSYVFYTYNLLRYHGTYGTVLAILEGILVGFIIYYIVEELIELIRVRLRYFSSFWNIVDIVLLSLCCIEIYLEYNRTKVAAERINEVLENGLTDAPFDDVVATQEVFNNIAAVILFLAWIKVGIDVRVMTLLPSHVKCGHTIPAYPRDIEPLPDDIALEVILMPSTTRPSQHYVLSPLHRAYDSLVAGPHFTTDRMAAV
ncbi:unnamed protein product [Heligmosomoides polygyrus]|uniref:PKD_channel domain-containing protein n=1 Tax=Heligmosomoides polygyrus TaxID=6339 RepID=A0A183GQ52_HELPZ|nr:unnamed protein product [Heligmosomoides polygyrus]